MENSGKLSIELKTRKMTRVMTSLSHSLLAFMKKKNAESEAEDQVINDARDQVNIKYAAVRDTIYKDNCVPVCRIEKLIKQVSKNSCRQTGMDLIHCIGTDILNKLSVMFTLCIQYGVAPDSFRSGILVPIPKKAGCDTSEARNWRPIVISSTFSKILELYVLDQCKQHNFSEMQFGFIPKRGTNTATSLLNDVISYVTTCCIAVYTCSLDAEGVFDAVPHAVIFSKAAKVWPIFSISFRHFLSRASR